MNLKYPKKINYAGPWITSKEVEYVQDAVQNGFYENYKLHANKLEEKVRQVLDVNYVLATNSATAALHLAVAALGLEPGDEVITTDSSCVASAMCIAYVGATGVFVDVEPDTWCISPDAIRTAITPKTKAILPVHWNGHPAAMDDIMSIANEHNLYVIEDGAPALGAEFAGKKVGTIGNVGCFSFQGAKVAIGGQGGLLVTNDPQIYQKAQCLASYGRTDSVMQYWSDYIGWNYTMPNLPAALALAQVERLDELIEKKRQIFQWYQAGLDGFDRTRLIKETQGTRSTYCYPAMMISENVRRSRGEILVELRAFNIDARPAQPRISHMPMFQSRFPNPVGEAVEKRGTILPSAFNLTEDDVAFVCKQLRAVVR